MSTPPAIAIVGMACRYADARSPEELWQCVLARRRGFRRMPPERFSLRDYHSADPASPDRTYADDAALIEGWTFDRVAFRVAGPTFRAADPAHWLALEVAAQALASAGFENGAGLPRTTTGVHVGNTLTGDVSRANALRLRWPYVRRIVDGALATRGWDEATRRELLDSVEQAYKAPFPPVGEETLAGGLSNTIAGRICNHFDLHGGGYTVDGACASSLLAVIESCTALASHDLDVAIAGGVDLSLDPFELVGFAKTGALARGAMRVYDARSSGFLPGEGCGMVVLMRHEDALAQRRPVLAVLRGWGIASDGSGGITRPEAMGQRLAVDRAYRRAGYGIGTVGYFEGHGTGTPVGDATELGVLTDARRDAGAERPAAIGSVKANLGHTKAAAGIAGLIKAVLAVSRRVLPPTTGCDEPHALLTGPTALLRALDAAEPWPADVPVRASVSAMGFGGIDTHVTLEGAAPSGANVLEPADLRWSSSAQDAELFVFAARDAAGLRARLEHALELAWRLSVAELADLASALAASRRADARDSWRAAVVAGSPRELGERLTLLLATLRSASPLTRHLAPGIMLGAGASPARVGFLFPGQGSPTRTDAGAIGRRFPEHAGFELPVTPEPGEPLSSTRLAQPAIAMLSAAALRLLRALGLEASVAVGHSLGELTALHWAGVLDEPALARVTTARGRAMAELGSSDGAMASVSADPAMTLSLIRPGEEAWVVAHNAPARTVVAGERAAVEAVATRARERGFPASALAVSHAFHTRLVAAAAPELRRALARESLVPPVRPIHSTVTGERLDAASDLAGILIEQVTAPVRFEPALVRAAAEAELWIEVGPGQVLSTLARECGIAHVTSLDAGSRSLSGLLESLGAAWAFGAWADPAPFFADRCTRAFDLDWRPRFLGSPCETAARTDATEEPPAELPVPRSEPPVAPDGVTTAAVPPLALLRKLICAKAELPLEAVVAESRLLADLHLNSISVGEILVVAARRLGVPSPSAPTDYARATVGQIADALATRVALGRAPETAGLGTAPAGVAAWVRTFVPRWSARTRSAHRTAEGRSEWQVLSAPGDILAAPLATALQGLAGPPGVLVCLPEDPGPEELPLLVHAVHSAIATEEAARFVLVQRGGGAGSLARTLALEHPRLTVCVVDLPGDDLRAVDWVRAEVAAATAFVEARYDREGTRFEPELALATRSPAGDALRLGPDDVLLVTGGGKGIAAEAALALARTGGAKLLILGRSAPASDAELAANLGRLARAGVRARYASADVTDAVAVARAIAEGQCELGPVTAVIHGAGTNVPRLLEELGVEDFLHTLAPKLGGAQHVLAALDPDRLKCFVAFGSVIARTGLRGEGDYGLANEWLSRWVERLQARLPACRCLCAEWSVWSGVGMGQRLGRLDALAEAGVSALGVDDALAELARLVSGGAASPVVVTSGRLGHLPTFGFESRALPLWRFVEQPRVHVPGVELVADARLTPERDPYLADHVLRGERILPMVMVMEAMAQVSMALGGWTEPPVFESLEFQHPILVAGTYALTLRVAALAVAPGRVELVVRSSSTGYATDHVRATAWERSTALDEAGGSEASSVPESDAGFDVAVTERVALEPAFDLYGRLLFHTGRFRRLAGYHRLVATECAAEVFADGATTWFGDYLPEPLVLGDPGARDAALHAIQACVPHQRLLPVSVRRVRCAVLDPRALHRTHARERARDAEGCVFDLLIQDAAGRVVEHWEGLRLGIVRGDAFGIPSHPALLGPYLERRIAELIPGSAIRVGFDAGEGAREARGRRATQRLAGGAPIEHRPDGKPLVADGTSIGVSHCSAFTLAVHGPARVACDVEPVAPRGSADWEGLLGAAHARLARELAVSAHDEPDGAASRVWCALECLKKSGASPAAPLALESWQDDGWIVLRSGAERIATLVLALAGGEPRIALAVLGRAAAPVAMAAPR